MYDPSIGQESLTSIDVAGVLIGHILFGVAATLVVDWSWIPLTPQERENGRSIKEIKKSWGWDDKTHIEAKQLDSENKDFTTLDDPR